jgi:hypothetical protein
VYSQRRNLENASSHPTVFYVEFPADSQSFQEIDANRLVRIIGDSAVRNAYSRLEVARLIDSIPATTDFTQFLQTCRPQ